MKIAPSILDANFQHLQESIDSIASSDRIHLDIMDGQYVPSITFGAAILRSLSFSVEVEAHLMVDDPERQFDSFQALGVGGITFHIENTRGRELELLRDLKLRGIRAGVCVDGDTDLGVLSDEVLLLADQILLMSIKAGKGGQKLRSEIFERIKALRFRGFSGEIEVDGGVNLDNVGDLKIAGADIVVVGSFLMKNDLGKRLDVIREFQKI